LSAADGGERFPALAQRLRDGDNRGLRMNLVRGGVPLRDLAGADDPDPHGLLSRR
jgi:hypothetical protein